MKIIEESEERLAFRIGACATVCHMLLVSSAAALVTVGLCIFLDNWIGIFAYVFIGLPGSIFFMFGIIGTLNARAHTFTFDKARNMFVAAAGQQSLERRLMDIRLVMIERRRGDGGPNTYAVSILFQDSRRCRLEGGVAQSSHDNGPPADLVSHVGTIASFLSLPQSQVPVLDVTQVMRELEKDEAHANQAVSRFFACRAEAPQLEPAISNYEWVVPPDCPLPVPPAGAVTPQMAADYMRGMGGAGGTRMVMTNVPRGVPPPGTAYTPGMQQMGMSGSPVPVVLGQPVQQPRQQRYLEVQLPPNCAPGQSLTVQAPTGEQIAVQVPSGLSPGQQTITVAY